MPTIYPLVSIKCLVFNQEPYLRQCLDGFVMQQTNFPFEAIVHDDCSTDGSVAIIREYAEKYPDIIKPIFEAENQYSKVGFAGLDKIMDSHLTGKYIAFCEGDDYWIDPLKLQKQVDLLEKHPDANMVYTSFETINDKGEFVKYANFERKKHNMPSGDLLPYLIADSFIMTLTVLIRKEMMDYDIYKRCKFHYDYTLALTCSMYGDIIFLDETTGCYRRQDNGLTSAKIDKVINELKEVKLYFFKAFVDGEGKPRSLKKKLQIKYNIIKGAWYQKDLYNPIIKISPLTLFLLPITFFQGIFIRVKKRCIKNNNQELLCK